MQVFRCQESKLQPIGLGSRPKRKCIRARKSEGVLRVFQGRRPSFAKCPFSGSKVPFSCVKNVIKIAFANLIIIGNICIYICYFRKIFSFPGRISYPENFLVYQENVFEYLGKSCCVTPPPPRRQHFREKIFTCPFLFEKCPSKPGPPNF